MKVDRKRREIEEVEEQVIEELPWQEHSDARRLNPKKHRIRGRGRPSL